MRPFNNLSEMLRNALLIGKAGTVDVAQHWGLALFSLATAFAVWFAVQDVQNPRTEGIVPVDGAQRIPVQAVNIPDGFIALSISPVSVRVRGREDDLPLLRSADFEATVDVKGLVNGEQSAALPVNVTAKRDNVDVVSVSPATVQVTLVRAATEEIPITILATGSVPEGYREIVDQRRVTPGFVTITGLPELVDSIKNGGEVIVAVNLNGLKAATTTLEGDLIARNASGNTVSVVMSDERARVSVEVEQVITRILLPVDPVVTGTPALGYRVTGVKIEPPLVGASGTDAVLDSLTRLLTLAVDVTGAKDTVTVERTIDRPQNVTLDRQSVSVQVTIEPAQCAGTASGAACGTTTMVIPLSSPTDLPASLSMESGTYPVYVRVSAPIATIATLKATDFKATVSFATAIAGMGIYTPRVTPPAGVTIEAVEPMNIRLIPAVTVP